MIKIVYFCSNLLRPVELMGAVQSDPQHYHHYCQAHGGRKNSSVEVPWSKIVTRGGYSPALSSPGRQESEEAGHHKTEHWHPQADEARCVGGDDMEALGSQEYRGLYLWSSNTDIDVDCEGSDECLIQGTEFCHIRICQGPGVQEEPEEYVYRLV